jgi:hypothetical protein
MLKELGIEKAPGKAENIIYNGNYEGIKSYDLDAKAPEAVDIEASDGLCYIRWAGELRVLRKKEEKPEDRERSEEQKQNEERRERLNRVHAMLENMDKRRREFILEIIEGKIDKVDGIHERLWNAMLKNGLGVSEEGLSGILLGKSRWELTEKETDECRERLEEMGMVNQMLLCLHSAMENPYIVSYDGEFRAEHTEELKSGYEVLKEYGWTFEEGEEELLDGTSELYVGENKNE